MVLTRRYVVAHLPKTGGSWLRWTLRDCKAFADHEHVLGTHDPAWTLRDYRAYREGRRLLGTIRDPWSWYASLYLHACSGNSGARQPYAMMYGRGATDFRSFLYGATHPWQVNLRQPLGVIIEFIDTEPSDLAAANVGLATWAASVIYGQRGAHRERRWDAWEVDALLDTAQLPQALKELEPAFEPERHPPLGTRHDRKRQPVRPPADYREWYDPAMVQWVKQADRPLINALGYRPFSPARSPLTTVGRSRQEAA